MERRRHPPPANAVLALTLAALAGLVDPVLGADRTQPVGTPMASPAPGSLAAGSEHRCPSVSDIDPGFFPGGTPEIGAIDPGFAPRPEPPPGRIAGEAIDPGFVVPYPPCPPLVGTPAAADR